MRPIAHWILCVLCMGALLVCSGCVQNPPDQKTPAVTAHVPVTAAGGTATHAERVAFVDSAVANATIRTPGGIQEFVDTAATYARAHGKETALAAFNNRTGPFVSGNLYIYCLLYTSPSPRDS